MLAPESTRIFLVALLAPFAIEMEHGWVGGSMGSVVAVSAVSSEPISEISSIRIDMVNRTFQTIFRFLPRVRAVGTAQIAASALAGLAVVSISLLK
jgi:hypothetical protein